MFMNGSFLQNRVLQVIATAACCAITPAHAQDQFENLPGYEQFRETSRAMGRLVRGGIVRDVIWGERDAYVQYRVGNRVLRYDFEDGNVEELEEHEIESTSQGRVTSRGGGSRGPSRGRQSEKVLSPDGEWVAEFRDWNLCLRNVESDQTIAVTTDGHRKHKYATGSWVYGEELRQTTAMWWSPDSSQIAYYEFDETEVLDFYLTPGLTKIQTELYIEGYPKPGSPNPVVGLHIYDLVTSESTRVPIGVDSNQYIYNIRWSPDGTLLIYNKTNRHQNDLEVMAYNPESGEQYCIVQETQETWQSNSPEFRWLKDGKRFIWETERNGWKHYELRHIDGRRLNGLTTANYPCSTIVEIDEPNEWFYYTAFSAKTPLHAQLHRVRLDGTKKSRLTEDDLSHSSFHIAPNHGHFIAMAQSIDTPPSTAIYAIDYQSNTGTKLKTLAEADVSAMANRPMPELFTFTADDGKTELYGVLYKPLSFDPKKTYPLLIEVYGGPLSTSLSPRFRPAHAYSEFGIIIAKLENRGTRHRGKAFESATYLKLGSVDLADQAAGVRALTERQYIDQSRVGITGHSYGGYMAALAILKYPDLFHVAVAGAPVTDWRNYDTIYTERFMRTPQENSEGYDSGSTLTFADNLEGKLLLLHGMVDDNVHPNNVWQLVDRFQKARKPFDMMFFPNSGHGINSPSVNPLKWEYLVEHLVLNADESDIAANEAADDDTQP